MTPLFTSIFYPNKKKYVFFKKKTSDLVKENFEIKSISNFKQLQIYLDYSFK